MATATDHALHELEIAKPVRVRVELENAEVVTGDAEVAIGVLPGTRTGAATERTVEWSLRVIDVSAPATATVVVWSEKAGTVRSTVSVRGASEPE